MRGLNGVLQRLLARAVAVAVIVVGALVGVFVATFVAVSALVLGLAAFIAGWFGTRSLRRRSTQPPRSERENGSVTVIDIEMREIDAPRREGEKGDSSRG